MSLPNQSTFAVAIVRDAEGPQAADALVDIIQKDLTRDGADLAFLFSSAEYADELQDMAAVIRQRLGRPILLGCTGEGVIAGSEEIERGRAATLWAARLPGVQLAPMRLSVTPTDTAAGAGAVAGWPGGGAHGAARPVFVMLAEPFSSPMDDILSELAERYPGARAVGGMAGGGRDVGENRLLLNDEVYDGGAVAVGVSGGIAVRTIVSQGCRPVGDRYVITKAENNVIYELGSAPALQRLETMFKALNEQERTLAHRALHLGIVIDEHRNSFDRGDFLVRNLIGADRGMGSLAVGDIVTEGQTVQFHVRDAEAASEDLRVLMAADRRRHPERPRAALLFSCCGRGRGLFGRPNHDISSVRQMSGGIPIAGFFAQGEIGPVGGSNFLHGYTASIALFTDSGVAEEGMS